MHILVLAKRIRGGCKFKIFFYFNSLIRKLTSNKYVDFWWISIFLLELKNYWFLNDIKFSVLTSIQFICNFFYIMLQIFQYPSSNLFFLPDWFSKTNWLISHCKYPYKSLISMMIWSIITFWCIRELMM